MSIKRMSAVWELSKHKGSDLLLLLSIADNAHDDGYAWPGIEYLAGKTRLSKSSVMRANRRLEKSGELFIRHVRNTGNKYIVTVGLSPEELLHSLRENLDATDKEISSILTRKHISSNMTLNKSQDDTYKVPPVTLETPINSKERSNAPKKKARARSTNPHTKHPAVQIFREETHYYPKGDWSKEVAETVGEDPIALKLWRSIVHDWVGLGWHPLNAKGMLKKFNDGGIPDRPGPTKSAEPAAFDAIRSYAESRGIDL